MNDNRQQKVEVMLHGTNGRISNLFRSESELQNEGKGGFLNGQIQCNIDNDVETIEKIELSLVSSHESGLHCNYLRVSPSSFEKELNRRDNHVADDQPKRAMSPSSYKVVLIRNSPSTFKIDRTNHDYMPVNGTEVNFWNEKTKTLNLGNKDPQDHSRRIEGLCKNIVKPKSKSEQKSESSNEFVHIREVLRRRKVEELREDVDGRLNNLSEPDKEEKIFQDMEAFEKNELNESISAAQRKKGKFKNLETMLADGEMHKAKLKAAIFTAPKSPNNVVKNISCTINGGREGKLRQYVGYSEWILASNRYGFEIDKTKTNLPVLTSCSIQVLTVFLKTCKLTSKMELDAQFMYRQKAGGEGSSWNTSANEIRIMKINGTSVQRVGDGKTTIQIFVKNTMGTDLNLIKNGIDFEGSKTEFELFLRITVRDESGYIGAEDTVSVNCIDHDCGYDKFLSDQDYNYGEIIKEDTIRSWISRGNIAHVPCHLCEALVIPGRRQYLEEKGTTYKRRCSNHSSDSPDDLKRSRPFGKALAHLTAYITLIF